MNTWFLRHCRYSIVAGRLRPSIRSCERLRAGLARRLLGAKITPGVMLNAIADFGTEARGVTIGGSFRPDPETILWTGTHEIGPAVRRYGPGPPDHDRRRLLARGVRDGAGGR